MEMIPTVVFSGFSGSGKTTLIEKLVVELKAQGLRLAVVKHDGHEFEIDHEGKDSWRFAQAGADVTLVCSETKTALIERRGRSLRENLERIRDVDLILVEGYKYALLPRIGVCRKASGQGLPSPAEEYLAVVTDDETLLSGGSAGCFGLDDVRELAGFLRERFQI